MKSFATFALLSVAALGIGYAAFTIPWSTLDGGGGKSTGTTGGGITYTLTGTIGQFDTTAAPASGGAHKFTGGFWAQLVGSNLPDGPRLSIARFPNGDASIQWQSNAAGWQLETSTNLTSWSKIGGAITNDGAVTIPYDPGVPKRFFRLSHP